MSKKTPFTLEYEVRSSPTILYEFISSSLGLQEWFAEKVTIKNNKYYFEWQGSVEVAQLVSKEQDKFIRYRWEHSTDPEEYFEFKIETTEISNQTILILTDFALPKELDEQKMLWEHQLKEMLYRLGHS